MKKERVPIRRNKSGQGWCVADRERSHFLCSRASAVLADVRFIQNARPMACVTGYDSTGEAIGILGNDGAAKMPRGVRRKESVVYDPKRRRFHIKGKPDETVRNADFLVLKADGTAIAGWK